MSRVWVAAPQQVLRLTSSLIIQQQWHILTSISFAHKKTQQHCLSKCHPFFLPFPVLHDLTDWLWCHWAELNICHPIAHKYNIIAHKYNLIAQDYHIIVHYYQLIADHNFLIVAIAICHCTLLYSILHQQIIPWLVITWLLLATRKTIPTNWDNWQQGRCQVYPHNRPLNDAATSSSNCLFNPNKWRRQHAISSLSFDTNAYLSSSTWRMNIFWWLHWFDI